MSSKNVSIVLVTPYHIFRLLQSFLCEMNTLLAIDLVYQEWTIVSEFYQQPSIEVRTVVIWFMLDEY